MVDKLHPIRDLDVEHHDKKNIEREGAKAEYGHQDPINQKDRRSQAGSVGLPRECLEVTEREGQAVNNNRKTERESERRTASYSLLQGTLREPTKMLIHPGRNSRNTPQAMERIRFWGKRRLLGITR